MRIAIEGCCHNKLDTIYKTLEHIQKLDQIPIDLLLICGDVETIRNENDLDSVAVPPKYRCLGDFHKYYSGESKAPIPTLFIGGNHEASNYLWELYYGGWVCENIYFLGYAGVVNFGGLRIGGLSGIYKPHDYNIGRFEQMPFTDRTLRSIYHVRNFEVMKLAQIRKPLDIFLSHDWPRGIEQYGKTGQLIAKKEYFQKQIQTNTLGSPACEELLYKLKPRYWFAAHLHVKFAAIFNHNPQSVATENYVDDFTLKDIYIPVSTNEYPPASIKNPDEIEMNFDDDDDDDDDDNIESTSESAFTPKPSHAEMESTDRNVPEDIESTDDSTFTPKPSHAEMELNDKDVPEVIESTGDSTFMPKPIHAEMELNDKDVPEYIGSAGDSTFTPKPNHVEIESNDKDVPEGIEYTGESIFTPKPSHTEMELNDKDVPEANCDKIVDGDEETHQQDESLGKTVEKKLDSNLDNIEIDSNDHDNLGKTEGVMETSTENENSETSQNSNKPKIFADSSSIPLNLNQTMITRFLALDRCLPRKDFLQIIDIPEAQGPLEFSYDEEWLAITKVMDEYLYMTHKVVKLPHESYLEKQIDPQFQWVHDNITTRENGLLIPKNFIQTAPPQSIVEDKKSDFDPYKPFLNPQTQSFTELLGINNKINPHGQKLFNKHITEIKEKLMADQMENLRGNLGDHKNIDDNNNANGNFKISLDSQISNSPLQFSTPNLRFALQNDLGRLFATQGNISSSPGSSVGVPSNNNNVPSEQVTFSSPSYFDQMEQQYPHTPLFRKIARPTPPSLNTNITQLLIAHNNNISGLNSSPFPMDNIMSPEDSSSHRRRDSNVSAMSIQLYDAPESSHQRRDSNVSNMSMQLDTPTSSGGEEGNDEDINKLSFVFPFTFTPRGSSSLSRPATPTTPPPYLSSSSSVQIQNLNNFNLNHNNQNINNHPGSNLQMYSTNSLKSQLSSSISHPNFLRRNSMDVNLESSIALASSSSEKPSPIQRAVRARRASLLPKTKSFQRIVHELQDESKPLETEIKQEYKTTKVLMTEGEKYMDSSEALPDDFLSTWIKFRDVQPSPPPYNASRLNPELEMSFRQDTPSPTSSIAGPWPANAVNSRIKRKASDDRFEPYFNPKRRAVSPSLGGSPPIGVPSPPTNNGGSTSPIGVTSTCTGSAPSTPLQTQTESLAE
ncbi:hypothetical protein G9A89_020596 [Geosiphon pyriformis]|nr:hypothetical protein G9A89_020596 [Geosiphon pyriformis]